MPETRSVIEIMKSAADLAGCTYEKQFNQTRDLKLGQLFTDEQRALYSDPRARNERSPQIDNSRFERLDNGMMRQIRDVRRNDRFIPQLGLQEWGDNGICYGLSAVWIDRMGKGTTDGMFTNTVSTDADKKKKGIQEVTCEPGLYDRAALIYRFQQDEDTWLRLTCLDRAQDGNSSHKKKSFEFDPDQNKNELGDLASWIKGSFTLRYFMLHVKGHSMAAVGKGPGSAYFFDPNGGIVSAGTANTLAVFFRHYFGNEKIFNAYKGEPNGFISADKYKLATSTKVAQRQVMTPKVYRRA